MADSKVSASILGVFLLAAAAVLGYQLSDAAIRFKQLDRSVTVKGLAEREYPADVVIWPIQYIVASNNLEQLYGELDRQAESIRAFLLLGGIEPGEISDSPPAITDKSAQQYGSNNGAEFRYTALRTVTVYSTNIDRVRSVMEGLSQLGRQGIVLSGNEYQSKPDYLFTRLNEIKPGMIEEATRNAREVAQKFASDSDSQLGKIRKASQGQFSIADRDKNNPHIKQVRVVSTVEYYLSD
ncbi:SIMPL domain-containing protein [Marinobacterium zhoushanense]|uniref:SIMPL domain-containing protein n=1 Tax=Marinobacterium zhoushanense TaxID=1679163 RepID=A0ABQ1JZT6_9GAMM|nr:SIMPL domain-containing protein [Marinobacterium zhoushanense]GGB79148.1 SIMPL domain-containing protein [Marinobacterium zhoushanense]